MSLKEKLLKNSYFDSKSKISVLDESKIFGDVKYIKTPVYALNIALSGQLDGGLSSGLIQIAGKSKSFKSLFGLMMVKAYLDNDKDAICLFYDSEFGTPKSYFTSLNIDTSRIIHIPITNIEELKFDIMKQLDPKDGISDKDKVIIFVDSIGNLASKKEVEDAENEKSVADMSRAKQLKSVFRMVTPKLTLLDIPMICINHTYESQGMFPTSVVSGGTGIEYSSNTVFIIGKAQEKDGTDLTGFKFTININKSRFVKEKSKIPVYVDFKEGIRKYTGLFDIAIETGDLEKPKVGWYSRRIVDKETGEIKPDDKLFRAKDCDGKEFWQFMFDNTLFVENVKEMYKIAEIEMLQFDND